MKKMFSLVLVFFLFSTMYNFAQVETKGSEDFQTKETWDGKLFGKFTPGIIFNTSNILLDLNEYQSGIGIKLKNKVYALRGLLNANYSSTDDILELDLGVTYERPFFPGRVAPYWGGAVTAGYEHDTDEYDADNWTKTSSITGSLSAVFGMEVYVFDFLSLFAEYSIGVAVSRSSVAQNTAGTKTDTSSFNYTIGTGLGNDASIGIVIYLEKQPITNNDEQEK